MGRGVYLRSFLSWLRRSPGSLVMNWKDLVWNCLASLFSSRVSSLSTEYLSIFVASFMMMSMSRSGL